MLETKRLILRQWKEDDFSDFAKINTHPNVREFFYLPATIESSISMAHRLRERIDRHGYGLWAVELKESSQFIGFTGLAEIFFQAHFSPNTEIAWRLDPAYWGNGYATEAAQARLADGLKRVGLPEIIAYTLPHNSASRRIMEKIGMTHNPTDNFDHPDIPETHYMRHMVLYRAHNKIG